MASTVSNGNDRSEKWQRPFQMATTVYEKEISCAEPKGLQSSCKMLYLECPTFPYYLFYELQYVQLFLAWVGHILNCFKNPLLA